MTRRSSFWDKFWRDEHGQDVIWQRPNIFLIIWFITTAINIFLGYGMPKKILGLAGLISLFIWAVLEVKSGANYFRKLLGAIVLIMLIVGRIL